MNSTQVRQTFLEFFKSKQHEIVPSAPMVVKNDPTLMFNNSGMAPFKDIFLGNSPIKYPRVADTQKCLRVSGKHNDLEEVGVDTYHHTMFEMLGNWSFGDYFKREAISWAWELLTKVYKIDISRLYVTVFEGYEKDGLQFDQEAYENWRQHISEERILKGNKKDNFWEMGDTGPCGPCSEIHVDMRSDEDRKLVDGKSLVNAGHPQVIEIWNNVFMEFERRADGSLVKLPKQHVDTGMGFERLCMVLQNCSSTYDTDIFRPMIEFVMKESGIAYGQLKTGGLRNSSEKTDIAIRVLCDHIRTIAFAIADGQLPSNNKAGYVIRRILRRAVRYYYSFLGIEEPFLHRMVPVLIKQMGDFFTELKAQETLITNVIKEEEHAFLRTLGLGITRFNQYIEMPDVKVIDGAFAFELYDTFGFPPDLTQLMARESSCSVDMEKFDRCMQEQKSRSRAAAAVETDDWQIVREAGDTVFTGYEWLETETEILRYRKVSTKNKQIYQLVLSRTPFYAESGGQVGDTGVLQSETESIFITDTKKENGVIIHFTDKLPNGLTDTFQARVDADKRRNTQYNHSATHLMHAALRKILGTHVEQKGSLVNAAHLRFDFSHFARVTEDEIAQIEKLVNEQIRRNIPADIRVMPLDEARKTGAMALFGEKYGEEVRVVSFDRNYSIELCGGTHVTSTGEIGIFKITSESAVAAGIRRIEAITAGTAEYWLNDQLSLITRAKAALKNPADLLKSLDQLIEQNHKLQKETESLYREKARMLKGNLMTLKSEKNGLFLIESEVNLNHAELIKDICFQLKNENKSTMIVLGAAINDKPQLYVALSDDLISEKGLNASAIVKEIAKEINGGGGGQPFYATAGGTRMEGIRSALDKARDLVG